MLPFVKTSSILRLLVLQSAALLAADDAKQLLEQSHTTGRLVVHVGAGDGALAADIAAARPSLIVRALDDDAAAATPATN
jgi:methylase of polypeptide subunit release factors